MSGISDFVNFGNYQQLWLAVNSLVIGARYYSH